MEDIKRCPFCNGEASLFANYNQKSECWFVVVKCESCGAQGGSAYHSNYNEVADQTFWDTDGCLRAIRKWNRRDGSDTE